MNRQLAVLKVLILGLWEEADDFVRTHSSQH